MEVISAQAILGAYPAMLRLVACEKTASRGDEVAVLLARQIRNHMNVEVVDAFADVFPALAPVEAARDAAVFDAEINDARIIGMDENIAHVAEMRRLRKPPVLAHFVGEFFKRGELFPMISAVFAAK